MLAVVAGVDCVVVCSAEVVSTGVVDAGDDATAVVAALVDDSEAVDGASDVDASVLVSTVVGI